MAFFDFTKRKIKKTNPDKDDRKQVLTIKDLMDEIGVAREGTISTYETEENPDDLGPETYIQMQNNDGEVQAIVRLLTLPIVSTPINILPSQNDKGERDFIETVFTGPENMGGMTTPLSFVVADMTRAIFEGFRLYEKVARIIEQGDYRGKIGWRKLAPRDAQTVELKADKHGGFAGAHQTTTFEGERYDIDIPPEKCMLYTFQKEKHWLYGQSILKTAYYHYDKKHKLYYIAHKKAEIDAMGLKILKVSQTLTPAQRTEAETVVDTIGINSRVTLPPGVELEITRGGEGGYDPMPLIEHHDLMMARSALTQAVDQVKYAYPYGRGTPSSQYLILAIESIMRQMEATLNTYAVAPLIDWNFATNAYPIIKFDNISDVAKTLLRDVFIQIIRKGETPLPEGFLNEMINEVSKDLKLKWSGIQEKKASEIAIKALNAFEKGKLEKANKLNVDAPSTPRKLKEKILRINKVQPDFEKKLYKLGEDFAICQTKNTTQ